MTNIQPGGSHEELQLSLEVTSVEDGSQRFLSEGNAAAVADGLRRHARLKMDRIDVPQWGTTVRVMGMKLRMKGLVAFRLNGDGTTEFPLPGGNTWTLVIVLPKSRDWGFVRDGKWLGFREYVFDGKARKAC